jgi:hypothetical protein
LDYDYLETAHANRDTLYYGLAAATAIKVATMADLATGGTVAVTMIGIREGFRLVARILNGTAETPTAGSIALVAGTALGLASGSGLVMLAGCAAFYATNAQEVTGRLPHDLINPAVRLVKAIVNIPATYAKELWNAPVKPTGWVHSGRPLMRWTV